MLRKILAVIVGFIAAGVVISLLEYILNMLSPMPKDLMEQGKDAVNAYIMGSPPFKLIAIGIVQSIGTFIGIFSAIKVMKGYHHGVVIAEFVVCFLAGMMNLIMYSHPTWFVLYNILILLAAGFIALKLWKPKLSNI